MERWYEELECFVVFAFLGLLISLIFLFVFPLVVFVILVLELWFFVYRSYSWFIGKNASWK